MVVDKFSAVRNKEVKAPIWTTPPYKQEHFKSCAYVVPIKDVRNLTIVFPTPDLHVHYKSSVSYTFTLLNYYDINLYMELTRSGNSIQLSNI